MGPGPGLCEPETEGERELGPEPCEVPEVAPLDAHDLPAGPFEPLLALHEFASLHTEFPLVRAELVHSVEFNDESDLRYGEVGEEDSSVDGDDVLGLDLVRAHGEEHPEERGFGDVLTGCVCEGQDESGAFDSSSAAEPVEAGEEFDLHCLGAGPGCGEVESVEAGESAEYCAGGDEGFEGVRG